MLPSHRSHAALNGQNDGAVRARGEASEATVGQSRVDEAHGEESRRGRVAWSAFQHTHVQSARSGRACSFVMMTHVDQRVG